MQTNPTTSQLAAPAAVLTFTDFWTGNPSNPATKVGSQYGSPMGRKTWGFAQQGAKCVRLFHVAINSGGYDTGGAYWGIGAPLFCATDGIYIAFTRATHRAEAAKLLNLTNAELLRPIN
jgi:hypothetical protein